MIDRSFRNSPDINIRRECGVQPKRCLAFFKGFNPNCFFWTVLVEKMGEMVTHPMSETRGLGVVAPPIPGFRVSCVRTFKYMEYVRK